MIDVRLILFDEQNFVHLSWFVGKLLYDEMRLTDSQVLVLSQGFLSPFRSLTGGTCSVDIQAVVSLYHPELNLSPLKASRLVVCFPLKEEDELHTAILKIQPTTVYVISSSSITWKIATGLWRWMRGEWPSLDAVNKLISRVDEIRHNRRHFSSADNTRTILFFVANSTEPKSWNEDAEWCLCPGLRSSLKEEQFVCLL